MKSKKPLATLFILLLAFAGLHIVRILVATSESPGRPSFPNDGSQSAAPRLAVPNDNDWQTATDVEKHAAQLSIRSQLDAFKQDDYYKARFYQGAALQSHFTDPMEFRAMMQRAYPEFAHYKSVTFGAARTRDAGTLVMVEATVTGVDGIVQNAIYQMRFEGGMYRVESVMGGGAVRIGGPGREQSL